MDKLFEINDYELLSKKVYHILKARIIKGDLAQGGKLFEAKIAEQLGVSRTPVREALRELAAEGFVTMTPNQGMVVNKASIKDIREVLQIRGVLEGLASRLAAKLIKKEEIKELERYLKQMEKFTIKNDLLAFSEMDEKFHELILDICGNKRLIKIHRNLNDIFHRFRVRTLAVSNNFQLFLGEHKKIMEAIKMGDSINADILSQRHVNTVIKILIQTRIISEETEKDGKTSKIKEVDQ